jgi:hypothetical protein
MSKKSSNKYFSAFDEIFNEVEQGKTIWCDDVLKDERLPSVGEATKKNNLKSYIDENPKVIEKVLGIYPSASTLVALVEDKLQHQITELSLNDANHIASDIVKSISEPLFKKFLADNLGTYYKGERVDIPTTELVEFLMNDLSDFYAKAGNSLVSIAGTLNEQLLEQAMVNQGMTADNFKRTGKNSEGDFVIYSSAGNRQQIGVEVKSYHARERLLRGLQDITGDNKVGFGYFIDASEFNAHRTKTLLQSDAAAIYMPQVTLNNVEASAKAITSNKMIAFQSKFYRPIEQFVTDMQHFCKHGKLPNY